ncbi:dihydropyrimidine dehydrogenase [Haloplanus rubicundus]|uniref:Dihydropyrimidine dehydrogenase n=1 Tax=Haloplanus rubicundus TaxID=1547898 RepID=A0A345EEZ8_9EURY|nr:tRNA-dihydrouridine synthase [Haloplanus rubicundus]AXG07354.1 dihydropyrimidine dehydrogenase [Haloplanus rubicundus]AXG10770.1 dihydropyrimidine dehydrogenase [Haloplanus rubicundus]
MLALASLSGAADADWARAGAPYADLALLGGIALDADSRGAARELVARGREEFLPDDPLAFVDAQLAALDDAPIRAGMNVRSATVAPIRETASICADHDAVLEINAHCRQDELCAVGCGETLLRDTERLAAFVAAAVDAGATVSVKVRAEVDGVALPATARALTDAGADVIHVDAMDSEPLIADVAAASDAFVLANNGVRDRATAWEYLAYGADGVSVGRPSDDPAVLERVARAVADWERRGRDAGRDGEVPG